MDAKIVLLVAPQADAQSGLVSFLQELDARLLHVDSGEQALEVLLTQDVSLVLADTALPGMDGYELCTKIRQTVGHRTTPVVFVTRHSDFNSRAKSTLSGGQDLIGKPFLAFEITVKALTLALRGRLQNGAMESGTASAAASDRTAPALPVASAASAQQEDRQ